MSESNLSWTGTSGMIKNGFAMGADVSTVGIFAVDNEGGSGQSRNVPSSKVPTLGVMYEYHAVVGVGTYIKEIVMDEGKCSTAI